MAGGSKREKNQRYKWGKEANGEKGKKKKERERWWGYSRGQWNDTQTDRGKEMKSVNHSATHYACQSASQSIVSESVD